MERADKVAAAVYLLSDATGFITDATAPIDVRRSMLLTRDPEA